MSDENAVEVEGMKEWLEAAKENDLLTVPDEALESISGGSENWWEDAPCPKCGKKTMQAIWDLGFGDPMARCNSCGEMAPLQKLAWW